MMNDECGSAARWLFLFYYPQIARITRICILLTIDFESLRPFVPLREKKIMANA